MKRKFYGKPLPAKRDVKAQLQFLALVNKAGENDENYKKRSKVFADNTNVRIQNKK